MCIAIAIKITAAAAAAAALYITRFCISLTAEFQLLMLFGQRLRRQRQQRLQTATNFNCHLFV